MKSLIVAALLTLTPVTLSYSQEQGAVDIGCFKGLNDTDSPASIGDCEAQDALNVESNLDGTSVKKRLGFSREATLTYSTSPVNGSFRFTCDSGDAVTVVCHDKLCSKSVNGAAFTNFITTAPASVKRWSFVSVDGDLYGANDRRSAVFKYDCTNLTHPSGIPAGSILELSEDRLIVADPSANPNRIAYSKSGDFTTFTTGLQPVDAYTDDMGAPGERTTGLKYHDGILYIFKQKSITACELGDQYTSRCRILSNSIGTADPSSIVSSPSGLFFKAQDGSFWRFGDKDPISRKITTLVRSQPQGSGQSNTQTTQSDWQAGSQSPSGSWDALTTAGSVFPSSVTMLDTSSSNFAAGALSQMSVNDTVGSITLSSNTASDSFLDSDYTSGPATWTVTQGTIEILAGAVGTDKYMGCRSAVTCLVHTTKVPISSGSWAFTYQFLNGGTNSCGSAGKCFEYRFDKTSGGDYYAIRVDPINTFGQDAIFRIIKSVGGGQTYLTENRTGDGVAPATFAGNRDYSFLIARSTSGVITLKIDGVAISSTSDTSILNSDYSEIEANYTSVPHLFDDFSWYQYQSSGNIVSRIHDTGFSNPIAGVLSSTCTVDGDSAATFKVRSSSSPNNDLWTAWVASSDTLTTGQVKRYQQYYTQFDTSIATKTPSCSDISLSAATTGQLTTQCIQVGSAVSSWGIISCDQTTSGNGSFSIAVTTGTDCTSISTGVFTTQTNNTNVSIATGAAVKIRLSSLLTSATDQAQVNACTLYWTNGSAVAPTFGVYSPLHNAVYWSITSGDVTYNNRVLKYDLNLNGEWFPFDLTASALSLVDNSVYFGSSSGAYWNKYGETGQTSDNGSAINAYWKSKDFSGGIPFKEKKWDRLSLVARNQGTGSLTATWANSSNISGSYAVSLSTTGSNYIRSNYNLPLMSPSSFLNVQVGNNAASQPFEVLGIRLDFTATPWRVLTR